MSNIKGGNHDFREVYRLRNRINYVLALVCLGFRA
jgi:hypothetical protein